MSLRYADLERKLGEIDRARAILSHGSQLCDPRVRAHRHTRTHRHRGRYTHTQVDTDNTRLQADIPSDVDTYGHRHAASVRTCALAAYVWIVNWSSDVPGRV
jgi:hypothetical protein